MQEVSGGNMFDTNMWINITEEKAPCDAGTVIRKAANHKLKVAETCLLQTQLTRYRAGVKENSHVAAHKTSNMILTLTAVLVKTH